MRQIMSWVLFVVNRRSKFFSFRSQARSGAGEQSPQDLIDLCEPEFGADNIGTRPQERGVGLGELTE